MGVLVETGPVRAYVRECYVLKSDLHQSCERKDVFTEPTYRAVALESIYVVSDKRRKGFCKKFIKSLCADSNFELVIVEGVHNIHLREALLRWGWQVDLTVMDFYKFKDPNVKI